MDKVATARIAEEQRLYQIQVKLNKAKLPAITDSQLDEFQKLIDSESKFKQLASAMAKVVEDIANYDKTTPGVVDQSGFACAITGKKMREIIGQVFVKK